MSPASGEEGDIVWTEFRIKTNLYFEILENRLGDLEGFLVKRGYNSAFVDKQYNRVRRQDRSALFIQKNKQGNNNDRICLVVDYYLALQSLYAILEELQSVGIVSSEFSVSN